MTTDLDSLLLDNQLMTADKIHTSLLGEQSFEKVADVVI